MVNGWIAGGIFCLVYCAVICIHSGRIVDAWWIWPLGTAACLVSWWILKQVANGSFPSAAGSAVCAVWVIVCMILAVFTAVIFRHMRDDTEEDLNYVIVLGAHVVGSVPSKALAQRIDRAFLYAQDHPSVRLILSGGKGEGEDITEAECMAAVLRKYGISEERLILEDKSTSTYENLVYSDRHTGCSEGFCGIVSNDFHISRALKLAKRCGYRKAAGMAAPSEAVMKPHFIMREVLAYFYGMIRGVL